MFSSVGSAPQNRPSWIKFFQTERRTLTLFAVGRERIFSGTRTVQSLRGLWEPLGRLLKASWGVLGASWELLGGVLGPLGGFSGASWAVLGRFCVVSPPRKPSWGTLAAALGPSWGLLGRLGGLLDRLGSLFEPSWGLLGPSWGHFGGLLGPSTSNFGGCYGRHGPARVEHGENVKIIEKPMGNQ